MNSKELDKILKDFSDSVSKLNSSMDRFSDRLGYVGSIGGEPIYDDRIRDIRNQVKNDTKELEDLDKLYEKFEMAEKIGENLASKYGEIDKSVDKVTANNERMLAIMNEISDLREEQQKQSDEEREATEEKIDALHKQYEILEEVNELELKNDGNAKVRVEQQILELDRKIHKEKSEEDLILRQINKDIDYHNKKLLEGVELSERINHRLESWGINTNKFQKGVSEVKKGFLDTLNVVKNFNEPWGKLDQTASNYAKHIGLTHQQLQKMRSGLINFTTGNNIVQKYNVNARELIELEEKYNKTIGRRTDLTNQAAEDMAALKNVVGEDTATNFTASLENFGLDQREAAKRVGQMFDEANKKGVSFETYSKNFLNNIKLAQNYTFERGLKGLREMAMRATEIKLDMQQVARFADKVSTLEGAIQTGAHLSVLGGSFAQFSDPMRMLYYGLNDISGLEKNIEGMFGNMAKFNKKTGQLEVSAYNRQRIRAAAEATGMDYTGLMDSIFAQGRRKVVEPLVKNKSWSKDQKEAIINMSQLDENGNPYVSINGEKKEVSKLTDKDVAMLTKTSGKDSDNIRLIAQTLLGYEERLESWDKSLDEEKAHISERTGFGQFVKDSLKTLSQYIKWIAAGVAAIAAVTAIKGIGGMVNGASNMLGSFGRIGGGGFGGGGIGMGGVLGTGGIATKSGLGTSTAAFRTNYATYSGANAAYARHAASIKAGKLTSEQVKKEIYKNAVRQGASPMKARWLAENAAFSNKLGAVGKIGRVGFGIGSAAIGIGATLGGGALQDNASKHMQYGNFSDSVRNRYVGGSALKEAGKWGGTLGAVGSFFGPLGTAIGFGLGTIGGGMYGFFKGKSKYEKEKYKKLIARKSGTELILKGDYTKDELKGIANQGKKYIENNPYLIDKIYEQDGIDINNISEFKHGGTVRGIGTGTSDSNLAWLSKGEYVMPERESKKANNIKILEAMRSGTTLVPRFENGGVNDVQPVGNQLNAMKVEGTNVQNNVVPQNIAPSEIKISPINISGTIKLDLGGYTKEIDSKKLLNDSIFLNKITDEILKSINTKTHMGYDKHSMMKKF